MSKLLCKELESLYESQVNQALNQLVVEMKANFTKNMKKIILSRKSVFAKEIKELNNNYKKVIAELRAEYDKKSPECQRNEHNRAVKAASKNDSFKCQNCGKTPKKAIILCRKKCHQKYMYVEHSMNYYLFNHFLIYLT